MVVHNVLPTAPRPSASTVTLKVRSKDSVADGVVALTLADAEGARLPDWTPGSHIDLVLPDGTTRQYSLCGDRWDPHSYRVAVLREPAGRGGSAYVHDRLRVDRMELAGEPRRHLNNTLRSWASLPVRIRPAA
ncbi:hypothetical protein ACFW2D_02640 [Streptomyces sp. NPDC058914]|uniref:hypothetical protein n=1 Tax=Streptomyces TaxID=1883 RepID=UPI0036C155A8